MHRTLVRLGLTLGLSVAAALAPAGAASADHAGTTLSSPVGTAASGFAPGAIGDWDLISSFPLGPAAARPLGVDVVPFTQGDKNYLLVSSVTLGFRVFDVTDPAEPTPVSDYGSAVGCASAVAEGLLDDPTDVLAAASGWENDAIVDQFDVDGVIGEGGASDILGSGTLAVIGTDAGGRCHDGVQGGMELVDISDPAQPTLLWLTRQTGENHNTTYDPYNNVLLTSTSDGGAPFIDILDLDGCKTKAQGGDGSCEIRESRYQFPEGLTSPEGETADNGCHDITVDGDLWFCAGVGGTVALDAGNLRDESGRLTGSPLPCETTTADPVTAGSREIVSDCQLSAGEFTELGLQSADVRPVAVVHHPSGTDPSTGGFDVSHQADPVKGSPGILMVTDENGGGLTGGGCPGGGVAFYDMRPETLATAPEDALGIPQMPLLALSDDSGQIVRNEDGSVRPAVFTISNYPPAQDANPSCTAHVFKQWGSENRAFIAWYFGGGHAFDWQLDLQRETPAVRLKESAYEYLVGVEGAQWSWTTIAYRAQDAADGQRTYYVVNADLARGVDFLSVTLPAAPQDIVPPPAGGDTGGTGGASGGTNGDTTGRPSAGSGQLARTGPTAALLAPGLALLVTAGVLRRRRAHP